MAVNDPNAWKTVRYAECDHRIYTVTIETDKGECRECGAALRWSGPRIEISAFVSLLKKAETAAQVSPKEEQ